MLLHETDLSKLLTNSVDNIECLSVYSSMANVPECANSQPRLCLPIYSRPNPIHFASAVFAFIPLVSVCLPPASTYTIISSTKFCLYNQSINCHSAVGCVCVCVCAICILHSTRYACSKLTGPVSQATGQPRVTLFERSHGSI